MSYTITIPYKIGQRLYVIGKLDDTEELQNWYVEAVTMVGIFFDEGKAVIMIKLADGTIDEAEEDELFETIKIATMELIDRMRGELDDPRGSEEGVS